MNPTIKMLAEQAVKETEQRKNTGIVLMDNYTQRLAELVVKQCVDKIETYKIPVGNSRSGELACEWTYNALKEIRDDIQQHFGLQ